MEFDMHKIKFIKDRDCMTRENKHKKTKSDHITKHKIRSSTLLVLECYETCRIHARPTMVLPNSYSKKSSPCT